MTNFVQDAITNNVPVGQLTHVLSATYAQMSGMIGCPISAHAPQRQKGNQMSAISDHNTGANKVSPICERPSAGGNVYDGTFDLMSLGDARAQTYGWIYPDCKVIWITQQHVGHLLRLRKTVNLHRSTPSLGHMEGEMALHPPPSKLWQRFVFPDILVV